MERAKKSSIRIEKFIYLNQTHVNMIWYAIDISEYACEPFEYRASIYLRTTCLCVYRTLLISSEIKKKKKKKTSTVVSCDYDKCFHINRLSHGKKRKTSVTLHTRTTLDAYVHILLGGSGKQYLCNLSEIVDKNSFSTE